MVLTVLGLSLFEIISSIDNAIINAEVLSTMGQRARKIFLTWGFLIAVFIMRGLLPWSLLWFTSSKEVLLIAGGTFLLFLFFNWLFMEDKNFGLPGERFFRRQSIWFYATVSILLLIIVWFALRFNPMLAFGTVIGSTVFFIVHGFQQNAEIQEKKILTKSHLSDISKLIYLEVIDATFSVDGVIGAFAFTLSIPLILLGNGLGAIILRKLTVENIDRIKFYRYLKNGAMYSMLSLGIVMVLDSFGIDIPQWVSPVITFITIGYFFLRSKKELSS